MSQFEVRPPGTPLGTAPISCERMTPAGPSGVASQRMPSPYPATSGRPGTTTTVVCVCAIRRGRAAGRSAAPGRGATTTHHRTVPETVAVAVLALDLQTVHRVSRRRLKAEHPAAVEI
jgi:hypothetical protein